MTDDEIKRLDEYRAMCRAGQIQRNGKPDTASIEYVTQPSHCVGHPILGDPAIGIRRGDHFRYMGSEVVATDELADGNVELVTMTGFRWKFPANLIQRYMERVR